jgi:pimeloyl-ACP methyl ester carboxylesterase
VGLRNILGTHGPGWLHAGVCPEPAGELGSLYLRHVLARQGHDTRGRLKDIRLPTLVMVGELEGDSNVVMTHRMSSEILARGIPHAKFVVLADQKHNYFASAPEEVHQVIRDFLR